MAKAKRDQDVPEYIQVAHVLFMDLVGYSKLPDNLQLARITRLESIVKSSAEFQRATRQKAVIALPTGDGMALVFDKYPEAAALCAIEISKAVKGDTELPLRMGINSGPAYPHRDIRGGKNMVGEGINYAQRAMDCGGADHILMTEVAAGFLKRFNPHLLGEYAVKHGVKLHLYNLYGDGFGKAEIPARNTEDPTRYLEILREETAWIGIQGLQVGSGKAHRFPIRDLYVPLTTSPDADGTAAPEMKERPRPVPLEQALTHTRLVLIGDPGSGKSTFLRWIAFSELTRPDAKEAAFPILIRVSELASHVRNNLNRRGGDGPSQDDSPAWLPHFLGVQSAERKWKLSAQYFDRQLEIGCLLMVDGLDEASNATERETTAALLDKATRAYPKSRFVVTTRPQSYSGKAVLDEFVQRQIADLDSGSMQTFLRHWSKALHAGDARSSEAHFQELRMALLSRPDIRRMARNPVMLTALAVVHWNEKRIPEQRADLYASIIRWLSVSREKRPGRASAAECVLKLAQLAMAMQDHPSGRQVQIPRREAAQALSPMSLADAERFLDEEEVDSGIVVSRGREVRFWHLTFQEYLAAKVLSGNDKLRRDFLGTGKPFSPEQRETVLLLAGVLSAEGFGIPNVDSELVTALLAAMGPLLRDQARCVGLLGAIERDLQPYKYKVGDPRYTKALEAVQGIFDAKKAAGIDFSDRLDAAEALGQAGDRRLAEDNWVPIGAGPFRMGADKNDDQDAEPDESPVHEVYLNAFKIGRYPVTVHEYREFVESDAYGDFQEPEDWEEQKQHPNRPVVGVSWHEAKAYCEWAGGRLPTEAEWERTARGVEGRRYPWGSHAPDASRANYGEGTPGHPTPVGLYPAGATPEGICDLAGNVWEWVADWYDDRYYVRSPRENPKVPEEGELRVVRGGSWNYNPWNLRGASRLRNRPGDRSVLIGFRCVREV